MQADVIIADWLDEIVVINESTDERTAGKITVYRSEGDALASLTQWPVLKGQVFAFSASGTRLLISISGDGYGLVAVRQQTVEGPAIARDWLEALARQTLDQRTRDARTRGVSLNRLEQRGTLPESAESLLAYVGSPSRPSVSWFLPGCLILLATIVILLAVILRRLI